VAAAVTGARASAVEPFAADLAVEAAHELYARHRGAIFRFCRSRLRSREEAEDAGQTTFLYAFRALRKGVVPVSELSWLLKIAENVCKTRRHDARRRLALEVTEDPDKLGRFAAPARPEVELLMPLEDALGRLTEPQRQALLLREWQGFSYREIAARLGIGRGAVDALLFRARRALAQELETPGAVRRRRPRALDLGWLAGLAKQLLGGGSAAKAGLAALAAGVAATVAAVGLAVRPEGAPPPEAKLLDRSVPVATTTRDAEPRRVALVQTQRPPAAEPAEPARAAPEPRGEPVLAPQVARPVPKEPAPAPASAPAAGPGRTTAADEIVGTVSSVVETVEPVVAPVVEVVGDVIETAEPALPIELEEPALPEVPEVPPLP
jgi:RNA polymerase sigma-70 factor (ECF subfamily)